MNKEEILQYGREVVATEAKVLSDLRLQDSFVDAVNLIASCQGRVVVTGIGKAGLIGAKISATMASTGTPSIELHPIEALHGDMGRVEKNDIVLCLSNSGGTEILRLLPVVREIGATVMAITGNAESELARESDVVLCYGNLEEACPLGMAPSSTTTAMLAIGDALALTVSKAKNFTVEDYARFHPGGRLGMKLMKVTEIMRTGDRVPRVSPATSLNDAVLELTRCRSGSVVVVDDAQKLQGVFSDGDLRRCLESSDNFDLSAALEQLMTRNPVCIEASQLATAVIPLMKEKRINQVPVVDAHNTVLGMIDVQDLLDIGLL